MLTSGLVEKKNALRELGNFVALALTKSQFNI